MSDHDPAEVARALLDQEREEHLKTQRELLETRRELVEVTERLKARRGVNPLAAADEEKRARAEARRQAEEEKRT